MKKQIIITLFIIISSFQSAFANSIDSNINIVGDSTKITTLKIYEDTKAGIQGLAKALKAPAEHVYSILVKQQVVNAIVNLVCILLFFIFVLICLYQIFQGIKILEKDENLGGTRIVIFSIFGIVSLITFIYNLCYIPEIFNGFYNPEYGAIKDIISFIK